MAQSPITRRRSLSEEIQAAGEMLKTPGFAKQEPEKSVTAGTNGETPHDIDIDDSVLDIHFQPPDAGTPAAKALQANAELKVSKLSKGLRKIRGIKHPKVKKLAKQLKPKKKDKLFSRNFKGKVIDGVHELYTLTAGMMLGMRYSVGRSALQTQLLTLDDFSYVEKIMFPPQGNNSPPFRTPPHSLAHTFKFKTYAPKVFSRIRDFFGLDSVSYMLSVCGNYNYLEFISNSKSGQFFFYSHDGRYMIKTQTNEENKFMKRILPHYYKYITENPHTTLVRIFGMHRVKMYHLHRKVHFVIMGSVFDTKEQIHQIYDLKGSLVGREATQKERESGGVLKDNDLIKDKKKLQLGSKKAAFIEQITKDAMFLAKLNIMDYSLLVGIHNRRAEESMSVPPSTINTGRNRMESHSRTPFRKGEDEVAEGSQSHSSPRDSEDRKHVAEAAAEAGESVGALGVTDESDPKPSPHYPMEHEISAMVDDIKLNGLNDISLPDEEPEVAPDSSKLTALKVPPLVQIAEQPLSNSSQPVPRTGRRRSSSNMSARRKSSTGSIPVNAAFSTDATEVEEEEYDDYEYDDDDYEYDDEDCGDSDVADALEDDTADVSNRKTTQTEHPFRSSLSPSLSIASSSANDHAGMRGKEGANVARMFRNDMSFQSLTLASDDDSLGANKFVTFGPGEATVHPWTSRRDGGINSRTADEKRGEDIYFLGIIDILQQYNASKRVETFVKGMFHDKEQISSVDPMKYATRFIKFMTDNTE